MNWFTKGWWKFWQVDTTPKTVCVLEQNEYLKPSGVGEPVIAIVKSFKEKGRWKIARNFDLFNLNVCRQMASFTATDTVTGEVYPVKSRSYYCYYTAHKQMVVPSNISSAYMPSWMTETEKEYVVKAVESHMNNIGERFKVLEDRKRTKDDKQAKVNQDKERQRLISLYCKE